MRCLAKATNVVLCVFFASLLAASTALNAAESPKASSSINLSPTADLAPVDPAKPDAAQSQIARRYGDLPLSFEENRGQSDQHVRFLSRGSGYTFFLTPREAVLAFSQDSPPSQSTVLRLQLAGSNVDARISGADPLPGNSNYFLGKNPSNWRTGVSTYRKVAYENIYPGINLVYYGNQRQLEYDFVVAPGADPRLIRLAVEGAGKLTLDAQGNLVLPTTGEEVRLLAPKIYQDVDGQKREIAGQWKLDGQNTAGFQLAAYDHSQPLVIDPVLMYSSFLGGSQKNSLSRIAIDSAGNAYVAGFTASGDFPASPTPQATTFGGGNAQRGVFVAKIDPTGSTLLYSTYLSGSASEQATGLALDASGNAYVTGNTSSADFPVRNAFQSTCSTNPSTGACSNAFLTKISPTGDALLYSTYLGGSGANSATSVAVDSKGNAYVVGTTSSQDFPATTGALQTKCGGSCTQNAFVAKFNATGESLSYATYLGGSGSDSASDVALDSAGNAYVTGQTTSTDFPLAGPFQKSCTVGSSGQAACLSTAFVAKIKAGGSALAYSTYLGGSLGSQGTGIAVDSLGSAYVTGTTQSADFPVLKAFQNTCGVDTATGKCSVDVFLSKFTPTGKALVYSTYLGGSGRDEATGVALDAAGNAHVVGRTESADFPTAKPLQSKLNGTSDAFVAKFNPAGSALVFSTYHGGSATEAGNGIALDVKGNIYVAGETSSPDFPTSHPFQSSCAGACANAFVSKMTAPPPATVPPTISKAFGAATIPLNGTTSLTFTINNPNVATTLTGIGFSDTLPAGLVVSTPNGLSGSCGGGTITATAGTNVISLSGASLAGSASCTFSVNNDGTSAGVQNNTTTAVTSVEGGNGGTASASVTVVAPPTISKAFGAASIPLNGTTSLTFTLSNPNATGSLTSVGFTDSLPTGLVVSTPNGLTSTCAGATIAAVAGSGTITVSGATLASSASCTVKVNVTGTTAGVKNNTTGNVTSTEGGTGGTASASLAVVAPPSIAKAFGAASIPLNGTTSLTLTITNPAANTVALTGVAVTDNLPVGIVVATPNGLTNTCGGTATAVAGSGTVSLTAGTVPTGSNCKVTVNVTGTADGTFTNTTGNVTSTNGGTGNTASANLTVATPPTITKVFGAAMIPLNGTTSLTFTIHNPSATVALTGVAFTDSLPSGLVVATPNALSNTCGGTATAVAGSATVSLTGAPLAASASCTVSVNITGTTAGVKNNSVQVTSTNGGTGNTSNASITVVGPPTISKAFGAASIPLNGSTSLSFTIQNNNTTQSLSGIGFTDTLPAGLVISTPNGLTGSCGAGIITATQGTNLITLTGATLAQSASCTFSINVTGTAAGQKNNTTSAVTSVEGGTGGTASDSIAVLAPPTISKAFGAPSIPLNTTTSLTFTITNPATNTLALTGVGFSDTLPTGLTVPTSSSAVCGGTLTTTASTGIALAGATVAASGTCVFSVSVTGAAAGQYANTTGVVTSTNGGTGLASNTANLTVVAPPTISKAFTPSTITLGATSQLNFVIVNPAANTVALTGVTFSDTLPAGLTVASSSTSPICAGTLTTTASTGVITLSGASLAVNTSCTFPVTVTGAVGEVYTNTTGAVTSANGGAGNAASANLTVQDYTLAAIAGSSPIVIQAGTSMPATITMTPEFTYAGTVMPAAPACPSGLTCTFSNLTDASPSSLITISAAAGEPVGPYSVVVTGTDNSTPPITHSAAPFTLFVECNYSLGNTGISGTVPTYAPLSTSDPYTLFVTETAGGSNCPWGPSPNAPAPPIVTFTSGINSVTGTSGQVSAKNTGSPVTYNVTAILSTATSAQTDQITVSYFQAGGSNNVGTSILNVAQEVPVPLTAGIGTTQVNLSATQLGTGTLAIPNTTGLAVTTVCSAANANGPDPTGNNFALTCAAQVTGSTVQLSVTVSAATPALRADRGRMGVGLLYAAGFGFPAIVFLGVGASAFGPKRNRFALRRITSMLGLLLVISLLVLLPACGGGFHANFGIRQTATYTLTLMGYVTDSSNNVTGVEIFAVPLTIVK